MGEIKLKQLQQLKPNLLFPPQVRAAAPWHAGICGSSFLSLTTPTLLEHESGGCSCILSTSRLSLQVREQVLKYLCEFDKENLIFYFNLTFKKRLIPIIPGWYLTNKWSVCTVHRQINLSLSLITCLSLSVCLCAAVQGNNEVSMWDMETGDRKFTLWASSAPPLSEMQVCVSVDWRNWILSLYLSVYNSFNMNLYL